jgi:hypothetical protein
VQQFVVLLEIDEFDFWFHEDGATCHTTNETLNMLSEFFGNHLISKIIWPPRSRDLTSPIWVGRGEGGSLEGKSL